MGMIYDIRDFDLYSLLINYQWPMFNDFIQLR